MCFFFAFVGHRCDAAAVEIPPTVCHRLKEEIYTVATYSVHIVPEYV